MAASVHPNNCIRLYRGINQHDDAQNGGRIIPKGHKPNVVAKHDGRIRADGTFRHGHCQSNTARAQQIETALYGACAISTTRSEQQAIKFATSANMEAGYVYILSESKLTDAGIALHEFPDPIYPDEKEVTLVLKNGQPLPQSAIVDKYAVNENGGRVSCG